MARITGFASFSLFPEKLGVSEVAEADMARNDLRNRCRGARFTGWY